MRAGTWELLTRPPLRIRWRRYHGSKGDATYFLTGTDEHGTKMAKPRPSKGLRRRNWSIVSAIPSGSSGKNSASAMRLHPRTTDERHKAAVTEVVKSSSPAATSTRQLESWNDEGQEDSVTETTARRKSSKPPSRPAAGAV